MILLLVLPMMFQLTIQDCLTTSDSVRKLSDKAHELLLHSELQFSVDLINSVGTVQSDKNVFFSPTSVFSTMLLAYFISANQTEASLKKVLHLAEDQDKLDIVGAYNMEKYYQKLRSITEQKCELNSANRMYVSKDLKLQSCMKILFGDEIEPADFAKNVTKVVRKINNWVAFQTHNVIKNFLPEDSVSRESQLILVNAAYFKGAWENQFPTEDTVTGKFHLSNGNEVKVKLMRQENSFKTRVDNNLGVEVLELPYAGDNISMMLLLPLDSFGIQDVLKRLSKDRLQDLMKAMAAEKPGGLMVIIPKFSVEESLDLTPVLESMGVGDLFQSSADFSTLSMTKGLRLSAAVHKAKVQVDEMGTEAAAATAFFLNRIGVDTFAANRPFIYFIYNKASKIVLFFGILNNPPLLA